MPTKRRLVVAEMGWNHECFVLRSQCLPPMTLSYPLRAALDRVDAQLDTLIYEAFPQAEAS